MKLRMLLAALALIGAALALRAHVCSRPVEGTAWAAPADPNRVTEGALRVLGKDGNPVGECPLKHTDVQVSISGFIARVNVIQQFHNPYKKKVEAVYVFPLSQDGAVDDMAMRVGSRVIRGQIKRREDARQIYEAAKAAGHVASLLDQERPNIFTQSVANIMPGEQVEVKISYVETLSYDDGTFKFAFPMVVGPRFIPGQPTGVQGTGWAPDTTDVPDASKITPPVTPEGTRAGHDISLSVDLDAGFPVEAVKSAFHPVRVERVNAGHVKLSLADRATLPNKDFILTYRSASDDVADAVLTHAGPQGKFLMLALAPPRRLTATRILPKEMIFVIDTSGSQMGWPIEKAKETMKVCIEGMHENDTFNLHAFSNQVVSLFPKPEPNTPANREKALNFLATRLGSGGTYMLPAIDAALAPLPDPERLRIVCFMTDGYVGNDMQVLARVKEKVGLARFFSFGVGNAVNRFLLDGMARQGRGEVEYVTLNQAGNAAAERFHQRIASPVLTDISVDWGGLAVADVLPQQIPDLFARRPLVIKARCTRAGTGVITIKGRTAGKPYVRQIRVTVPANAPAHDVLVPLWARARIEQLMSQDYTGIQSGKPSEGLKEEITGLGLDFRLMTQFTSFVAVEEMVVTEGGKPRTIAVPVEMPEGVSYQGVFGPVGAPASLRAFGRYGAGMVTATAGVRLAMPAPAAGGGYGGYGGGGRGVSAAPTAPKAGPRQEVSADAPAGSAPAKPLTPAEQRAAKLKAKLDGALRELPARLAKEGKDGSLKTDRLEVKDGRVEVAVWLNDNSDAALAKLKELGFETVIASKVAKMVVGKIPVAKLEELALLDAVRRVEVPSYGR